MVCNNEDMIFDVCNLREKIGIILLLIYTWLVEQFFCKSWLPEPKVIAPGNQATLLSQADPQPLPHPSLCQRLGFVLFTDKAASKVCRSDTVAQSTFQWYYQCGLYCYKVFDPPRWSEKQGQPLLESSKKFQPPQIDIIIYLTP